MGYENVFKELVVKGVENYGSDVTKANTAGTVSGSLYNQTIYTFNIQNCNFYGSEFGRLFGQMGELKCSSCNYYIAQSSGIVNIFSSHRTAETTMTIGGMANTMVQHFCNQHGYEFDVFTCNNASLQCTSEAIEAYTWFDDYTWKISQCFHCKQHIGWTYEILAHKKPTANRRHFFGLIWIESITRWNGHKIIVFDVEIPNSFILEDSQQFEMNQRK